MSPPIWVDEHGQPCPTRLLPDPLDQPGGETELVKPERHPLSSVRAERQLKLQLVLCHRLDDLLRAHRAHTPRAVIHPDSYRVDARKLATSQPLTGCVTSRPLVHTAGQVNGRTRAGAMPTASPGVVPPEARKGKGSSEVSASPPRPGLAENCRDPQGACIFVQCQQPSARSDCELLRGRLRGSPE